MLHRKFAVIKLWPGLKTAEDECVARLKVTAESLGLECIEVDSFARTIDSPHVQLTRDDVDFVLSLHFETPKRYDIFSFVALWNPLQFYHEWGYRRFTRHLLTHDDFLSCSSPWADDHVKRMLSHAPGRDVPEMKLYHSLSEPILAPSAGDGKLFYAGINWERVTGKPMRHGPLLKLLDQSGDLRIYGPRRFQGVNVWKGFKSYAGPVAFDGVSLIRLIHKAGASLVLSSEAHRQSELMSSRLFESLAAGAVIICDENPFARRFFGKTLLYVDTTLPPEEAHAQIQSYLDWIRREPEKARALAAQAQDIFRREFALDHCLQNIYEQLPERKQKLERLYTPKRPEEKISVIFLMPEYDAEVLEQHINSFMAQRHVSVRPILAMDGRDFEAFGRRVQSRLHELAVAMPVETLEFFERFPTGAGAARRRRRMGSVIWQIVQDLVQDDYFAIIGPHEQIFSDHLCSLLCALQDSDDAGSAWSDMISLHKTDGVDHGDLTDEPADHLNLADRSIGFGRFLFRRSALPHDIGTVLPYLDALAMDLLFGISGNVPTRRCTLTVDIQERFTLKVATTTKPEEEREILIDYAPSLFSRRVLPKSEGEAGLSIESLTPEQKTQLAVELAHSVPFPDLLKTIGFGLYRIWLKRARTRLSEAAD